MNMKKQNIYPLLQAALLLLLASCTQEEFPTVHLQDKAQQLTISVTDGGYAPADGKTTRAVENGYTTEFTEGDACGLYVVRGTQTLYSNVKLIAERDADTGDLVWKSENTTPLMGGLSDEHYYLYYPYQADMSGKTATLTGSALTDAEFFAPLIASWQPQEDQSTYAAYTISDLMTAEGSATTGEDNTLHLSFTMNHRMALTVIEMPISIIYQFTDKRIPDYIVSPVTTFSGIAQPLRMNDGTFRYLVNHATSAPTIKGSYDNGSKKFTINPSGLSSGSYKSYKVDGATRPKKPIEHKLQRGDYLRADGSLVPNWVHLTYEQKANVVAIVFWTPTETDTEGRITPASLTFDKIMAKEHPFCNHGLAVSIKNVSSSPMTWQNVSDGVEDFQSGPNFNPVDKVDYVTIREFSHNPKLGIINRILGYQNTKVLWAYNDYCKANGKTDFLVTPAELLKTFITQNPAPANSTGWYIPSAKELHMLCYKDVDDITSAFNDSYCETRNIVDASISAVSGDVVGMYNNYQSYWSSSEGSATSAYNMYSYTAFIVNSYKDGGVLMARAVCAF